jgi:hypothetical protein
VRKLTHDSFIKSIDLLKQILHLDITLDDLIFRTGHWLRITVAIETKRQQYLGHPSADTFWDYFSLIKNWKEDIGFDTNFYFSDKRVSLAKETTAKGIRTEDIDPNFIIKDSEDYMKTVRQQLINNSVTLLQDVNGKFWVLNKNYNFSDNQLINIDDLKSRINAFFDLDLGPIILSIYPTKIKKNIPWKMLLYLAWTFERGEEPTEIDTLTGISAVSGWKAYARWMQGYLLPIKEKSIHPSLYELPTILIERRTSAMNFLEQHLNDNKKSALGQIYTGFYNILQETIEELSKLQDYYNQDLAYQLIRNQITKVYFSEQKSLSYFKELKKIYHDLVKQRSAKS